MVDTSVRAASSDEDFADARKLFQQYRTQIGEGLCFQDFQYELDHLQEMYTPPGGSLLLGQHGTAAVGCVAHRRVDDMTCEMRRLYVKPPARRLGLGGALAASILESGCALGYCRMILETLPSMQATEAVPFPWFSGRSLVGRNAAGRSDSHGACPSREDRRSIMRCAHRKHSRD